MKRGTTVMVPVDLMDTEAGGRIIVTQHHDWNTRPISVDGCCAFCAEQLIATPIWFELVVRYARLA